MADEEVTPERVVAQEAEAREMGWRPQDEFKGDPEKWVDAKTFLDRGEHVLPLIKASNARLREDLVRSNTRINELTAAVADGKQAMEAMERAHQGIVADRIKRERERLTQELIQAKKAGDVEGEVKLQQELTDLKDPVDTSDKGDKKPPARKIEKDYSQEPEYISWRQDNSWFGVDKVRTALANQISLELRAQGDTSVGRAYLDKITIEVNKEMAKLSPSRSSKVEASRGGATRSNGSGGKGYADLPADAKEACEMFTKDLVGPNRRYAKIEDWHAAYAKQYFSEV